MFSGVVPEPTSVGMETASATSTSTRSAGRPVEVPGHDDAVARKNSAALPLAYE
jgi:hypothetical protein